MITFDAIVIGVGQTGPFLERRLAAAGISVAVVEHGLIDADARKTGKRLLLGKRVMPRREAAREIEMADREIRDALERHWAASDANDFAVEHEIYREDAVLHYPQSGERIRGRHNIQESRTVQPSEKRFAVRRIIGNGDLWVTEFVLSYDDVPSYAVSIMEFSDGKVARETQYFGDPFKPGPSRAHLVELNN
jgi:choline dehydrogenase-like flavoprotein